MDMISLSANSATFAYFHCHTARNNVATSQIFVGRRIAFHEPLALGICQIPALAAGAFSDQTASTVNTSRVELHKLHILQRQTDPCCHPTTIAGTSMRRGRRKIGPPTAPGC